MLVFGLGVMGEAINKMLYPIMPDTETMGAIGMLALGANLVLLAALVALGAPKIPAQATAIILVTPLNFVGNKLWSFRRRS